MPHLDIAVVHFGYSSLNFIQRAIYSMDLRDLGALIRGGASALDVLAQWAKSKGGTVEAELMGPIEASQGTTILCFFYFLFSFDKPYSCTPLHNPAYSHHRLNLARRS